MMKLAKMECLLIKIVIYNYKKETMFLKKLLINKIGYLDDDGESTRKSKR